MPIDPISTPGEGSWKISVAGPDGVEFMIQAVSAVSTEGQMDAVSQSLVNHLDSWPDLVLINYAQKTTVGIHNITPDL